MVPSGQPVWESEIAQYWWEDHILISLSKNPKRTVDLLKKNAQKVKEISGGRPVPLLIYLSSSPVPDKATRAYSRKLLPELYSAMAMISEPGLSATIMKVLFALQKPPIPMKSFTDKDKAIRWLKELTEPTQP